MLQELVNGIINGIGSMLYLKVFGGNSLDDCVNKVNREICSDKIINVLPVGPSYFDYGNIEEDDENPPTYVYCLKVFYRD